MSINDDQRVKLMYDFMNAASLIKSPITFKGAMVLTTLVQANGKISTFRMTRDVDGDWNYPNPSNDTLFENIKNIVSAMNRPDLSVMQDRELSDESSARFKIVRTDGSDEGILFTFDLNAKSHSFATPYSFGDIQFYGANIAKMYADKLLVVSSKKVFRRAKDVYDLYLLSHFDNLTTSEICKILTGKSLGQFQEFLHQTDMINHAYERMRNVTNKPDFYVMYNRVKQFVEPFITGNGNQPMTWEVGLGKWV